ncbi:MAG: GH116 family glycosyl hydrolase [Armatimonadota bacterium]
MRNRNGIRRAFGRKGWNVATAALMIAVATLVVLTASSAGWAVVRPAVVFQPSVGTNYVLYMPDTRERIVLQGTAGMQNAIVGDVDGDGLEDDLVYHDSSAGGLRYYAIPPNGLWHLENVHVVPGAHTDAIPLTVLRQGGTGTPGLVVYKSAAAGQSYAARVTMTYLFALGVIDQAFAVDARLQGFKGDLFWWTNGVGTFWKAGIYGASIQSPSTDWLPLGGGRVIPDQPERTMAFFSPSANALFMTDAYWNYTRIDGTNGDWGPHSGRPTLFGDVDNDGLDEIVFVNCPGYPLQWYSVPNGGGPWNSNNGYVCDDDTWLGWQLHGVARIDFQQPAVISVARISDLRSLPYGAVVRVAAKVRTMLVRELDSNYQPVDTGFYIEEPDRTSGIRVAGAASAAQDGLVTIQGELSTVNGEPTITNAVQTPLAQQSHASPLGVTIKSLYGSGVPMTGLMVRVAGSIVRVDPGFAWFELADGSARAIKVYCPDIPRTQGFAVVTGCVGAEAGEHGTIPVIRASDSDQISYIADASDQTGPLGALADFQGIVYSEVGRPVGMPLGGLGTGAVELSSQGLFMEFGNVNNWAARIPSIPGTGLWVVYKTGGATQVFPLSGQRVRFEGNFPFARLTFPDLPVDVTLWCWSPFILHDARRSGYPAAIFDAEITNRTSQPADVGLMLSYGTDYGDWLRGLAGADLQGAPVTIQSTSAPYSGQHASGISFSATAGVDQAWLDQRNAQIRQDLENAYLSPYDLTSLDMRQACNRSYLNSPFGTDPGNAPLKFADLQPGPRTLYGFPFQVVDGAANAGKSIVMAGPETSTQSVTIPVNRQADCLFFLGNCAGWAGNGTANYVIRYTDGSQFTVPLRYGCEIADWMGGAATYSPAHITCANGIGGTCQILLYAVPTDGTKVVQSVELQKSGQIAPIVFAVTTGRLSSTPLPGGVIAARQTDIDRMMAATTSPRLTPNTDAGYTLAARSQSGARTLTYQVTTPDALPSAVASQSGPQPGSTVYAVEQRFSLAPGEKAVAGLVCGWYAPNHYGASGYRFGHAYENWFAGSSAVAEEIARDHDTLLHDTKQHYDVIATSTLPKWYREMIQSNFYLMPVGTWSTKGGIAFTYEAPNGCPLYGTMDVRYYGSFTQLAGFPDIDATVLRQYAGIQHADGFIPHDLGGASGLSDVYWFPTNTTPVPPNPAPGAYTGYWTNLPIKFCLEVARHYQWTGNVAFLQEMWPHVKRAVTWIDAQDTDDDGLPETSYGYDGWTMIDKCGYDANQWNAMLIAVARLADDLGEHNYASELRAIHQKAANQIERLIWTGSYYKQSATTSGGGLDWVSILQVAGTWYADILGFNDGLSRQHVRTAMLTMDSVLGGDAVYGLTDALRADGSRINWWICDGQAIGWQYFFASHCMYEGLDDIALRVCDEMWRQFTVENARIPWCQEEFIHDPQNPVCPYWLLRDMRMGSTMVMSYAAAGVQMDIPRGTASISPASWIWQNGSFTLPILMPKWLGQVKYSRGLTEETYELTNLQPALALNSLRLRTQQTGTVMITVSNQVRQAQVGPDGTVDIGEVTLGEKIIVRLSL